MESDLLFQEIVGQFGLGKLTARPERVSGGFMHRMYKVETSAGAYALKLLNPVIMRRPDAMGNFQRAEKLERLLQENDIPVIPALEKDGLKMQCLNGQYYYLFDWFEGKALDWHEIGEVNCRAAGKLLAKVHRIPLAEGGRTCDGELWEALGKENEGDDDGAQREASGQEDERGVGGAQREASGQEDERGVGGAQREASVQEDEGVSVGLSGKLRCRRMKGGVGGAQREALGQEDERGDNGELWETSAQEDEGGDDGKDRETINRDSCDISGQEGLFDEDWDSYIERAAGMCSEIAGELAESRELLYRAQREYNAAVKSVPNVCCVCDGDMDCKNVLWKDGKPHIIDLECLDYGNPFTEMYQLALSWAGGAVCSLDFAHFGEFVHGYRQEYGDVPVDWRALSGVGYSWLDWLAYNVRRSLGIECADEEERQLGVRETRATIRRIRYYASVREELVDWLEKGFDLENKK